MIEVADAAELEALDESAFLLGARRLEMRERTPVSLGLMAAARHGQIDVVHAVLPRHRHPAELKRLAAGQGQLTLELPALILVAAVRQLAADVAGHGLGRHVAEPRRDALRRLLRRDHMRHIAGLELEIKGLQRRTRPLGVDGVQINRAIKALIALKSHAGEHEKRRFLPVP